LTYGVLERKGFILLTGEVGSGKTTIVQALLKSLDKNITTVYLSNPALSPIDFINYLGRVALKRDEHFKSKADFLLEFEEFLRHSLQHQKSFVLIIDEAQKLSYSLLEEIRLLSNMESAEEKLINIFLVGQPELNDKLSSPRCRQLLQRISIRHHISPLNQAEAREYVNTRLKAAGAKDGDEILSKDVVKTIHHYSSGYPRMINILADNCLLLGYSRGTRKITSAMIRECYDDLQLEGSTLKAVPQKARNQEKGTPQVLQKKFPWKWLIVAFILGMGIASFLIAQYGQGAVGRLRTILSETRLGESLQKDAEKVVVREKLPDRTESSGLSPKVEQSETNLMPNAAERSEAPTDRGQRSEVRGRDEDRGPGDQVVASSEAILERSDPNAYRREARVQDRGQRTEVRGQLNPSNAQPNNPEERVQGSEARDQRSEIRGQRNHQPNNSSNPGTDRGQRSEVRGQGEDRGQRTEVRGQGEDRGQRPEVRGQLNPITQATRLPNNAFNSSNPITVTVKVGDTLALLAISIYGRVDEEMIKMIQNHNPGLKDVNLILVGQTIIFPALGEQAR
jgi:type II secretory pathway predicted ATPase ExeA/phage tail protein X